MKANIELVGDRFWIRRDGQATYNFDLRDLTKLLEEYSDDIINLFKKNEQRDREESDKIKEKCDGVIESWPEWKRDALKEMFRTSPSER